MVAYDGQVEGRFGSNLLPRARNALIGRGYFDSIVRAVTRPGRSPELPFAGTGAKFRRGLAAAGLFSGACA